VYGLAEPRAAPSFALLKVASLHSHPRFGQSPTTDSDGLGRKNDIGVVVLSEPVPNGIATPVLAPDQLDRVLVAGAGVHIVGYGVYDLRADASGSKHWAVTPFVRRVTCEMLAGSPGNPDSCSGDSGGPAYVRVGGQLYLAGATSRAWGGSRKTCGQGGIYTLVPRYIDWIQQVAGAIEFGAPDAGVPDAAVVPDATVLDADAACFPLSSICNPVTSEGCDGAAGEACRVKSGGGYTCEPAGDDALPGRACDDTERYCGVGYHCGSLGRCEKYCCSNSDCGDGGACTALAPALGTLGTCGVQAQGGAAGAGGAASGGADGGGDATPSDRSGDGESEDAGCGCRAAGRPPSSVALAGIALTLALGLGRRRRHRG
jgi:MYXO-CTERM domain-containing protein